MTRPRRSLAAEIIAGAILGLFAGLAALVLVAGVIHILEGIDRTLVGVLLSVCAGGGVTAALFARGTGSNRDDPDDAPVAVVTIGGVTDDDDVPWSEADPFGRDWTGGRGA